MKLWWNIEMNCVYKTVLGLNRGIWRWIQEEGGHWSLYTDTEWTVDSIYRHGVDSAPYAESILYLTWNSLIMNWFILSIPRPHLLIHTTECYYKKIRHSIWVHYIQSCTWIYEMFTKCASECVIWHCTLGAYKFTWDIKPFSWHHWLNYV